MLVLTRKKNETILINDNISITVLSVEGDKVKLGIEAPKNISIYRQELLEAVKKENMSALSIDQDALSVFLDLVAKEQTDRPKQE